MKIQEFCVKIHQDQTRLFQTLRALCQTRRQMLLQNRAADWQPWGAYR